jgi:tRNA threonylcarbamoyladenosine biosynthesis protein TsaB
MKRILAFDTSWDFGVVGAVENARLKDKVVGRSPRAASEGLLPWIMEVTGRCGWRPSDIEMIAVGRGPGSFTGTRIALAVAKGLAFSLHIPLVTTSSLEALAVTHAPPGAVAAVVADARRGEVLFGLFAIDRIEKRCGDRSVLLPLVNVLERPSLDRPETARQRLERAAGQCGRVIVCGNGMAVYPSLARDLPGVLEKAAGSETMLVDPESVALLALRRWLDGERDDASTCEPVYLRGYEKKSSAL